MKIAVVGCGALGSYYGAKLCQAGHQVHFLLRSDYDAVRRDGVWIESTEGNFRIQPECARQPEEIGPSGLVLIGLKTTANYTLPQLLPPLAGPYTAVLTLQNGLGNEQAVAAVVGPERTLGGLCFVCLNRFAPGRIRHLAHGMVKMGEYGRPPLPRTKEIADAFAGAGIRCTVEDNLERAHWEKLVWNIPFNGLGVAGVAGFEAVTRGRLSEGGELGKCLTTQDLLSAARWEQLVLDLMLETIAAARALGLEMPDSIAGKQIERTRQMGAYKASTLLDFEAGRELELESLFLEPHRQATKAGVSCPRLGALCSLLSQLATRRADVPK
ncbi:MAG: 2-dehydropantoate 2-reductase [Limisphaerales bacterium]